MDWSKAKTILIIVLLIFCLVLSGILLVRNINESKELESNAKAALEYLTSVGVKVETEIPNQRQALAVLFVEYNELSSNDAKLAYRNFNVYTSFGSTKGYTITSEGKNKAKVVSASSALLSAVSEFENTQDLAIKDIELCYYIDSNGKPQNGSRDTAIPAWRITTNKGTSVVSAY